ncbi:MAG: AI-2E family transporter [Patescibacteria group bacterium]
MMHQFFRYLFKHQVLLALFIITFVWFIIQVREIIVSLFLAYIIMAAVLPFVNFLRKRGLHKVVSVVIAYITILLLLFLLFFPLVPFIVEQIQLLISRFPDYLQQASQIVGIPDSKQLENYLNSELGNLSRNAVGVTTQLFGGLFSLLTTFIVSFYLLLSHENFNKGIARLFHPNLRPKVMTTVNRVNEKLGAWLRGQLLLSFFIGLTSWIALTLAGVPYALPLAILAGILEVLPTLGPILSAIPAVIVALTISPTLAVAVIIIYILIQALENNFLVPNIMQKAVGLNPVIVILAVLIGSTLMGIAGALLAIPFVSFIIVIFKSIEE